MFQLRGVKRSVSLFMGLLLVAGTAYSQPGQCPQPRFTGKAPEEYLARTNPIPPSEEGLKAAAAIFQGSTRGAPSCAICHGAKGDGKGALANLYDPPPRNFSCEKTIKDVADGQLFWIIRFGSPGAAMPPHPKLSDDQVWNMVSYLRQLAK